MSITQPFRSAVTPVPTVAVHGPEGRPVLAGIDRVAPGSPEARHAASALAWSGRVDLDLHADDPRTIDLRTDAVPAEPLVAVTVQRLSGGIEVEVAGTLDATTVAFVRDAVEVGLTAGGICLHLHLGAVVSCDDAGVELIASLQESLTRRNVGLVAVAVPPALRKVLRATARSGTLVEQDLLPAPVPGPWLVDVTAQEPPVHW